MSGFLTSDGRIDIDALERSIFEHEEIMRRAERIIDRLWPFDDRAPHGFYEPDRFLAHAAERGRRNVLRHKIIARLRAKRDGGLPRIRFPLGAGDIIISASMRQAERELRDDFPE